MKTCTKCGLSQPVSGYTKKAAAGDGLSPACKACVAPSKRAYYLANRLRLDVKNKEWAEVNPAKTKGYSRSYQRTNPLSAAMARAKVRAKEAGVPFTLTLDAMPPVSEFCPVLGIPLVRAVGKPNDFSPSLDRLSPHLGYVPGNVTWISYRANRIKTDATLEELENVTRWTRESLSLQRTVS